MILVYITGRLHSTITVQYNTVTMKLSHRIVVDPTIMVGKPVIAGTRIPVELILDKLAQNMPVAEILRDYPRLHTEDILAVLAYARDLVKNEDVYPLHELPR